MRWNQGKFQMLRMGPNDQLIQDTTLYNQGNQKAITVKDSVKDLGIMVDTTLSYKEHIQKATEKPIKRPDGYYGRFPLGRWLS